jgi:hypothetical protein
LLKKKEGRKKRRLAEMGACRGDSRRPTKRRQSAKPGEEMSPGLFPSRAKNTGPRLFLPHFLLSWVPSFLPFFLLREHKQEEEEEEEKKMDEVSVLPRDTHAVDIHVDMSSWPDLKEKEITAQILEFYASIFPDICPWGGVRKRISLGFDIAALAPLYIKRKRDKFSGTAEVIREETLRLNKVGDTDLLGNLDVGSAGSCPVLQWQWLAYLGRTLRPPKNDRSVRVEIDWCPRPDLIPDKASYTALVDQVHEWFRRVCQAYRRPLPNGILAHHVIAQQIFFSSDCMIRRLEVASGKPMSTVVNHEPVTVSTLVRLPDEEDPKPPNQGQAADFLSRFIYQVMPVLFPSSQRRKSALFVSRRSVIETQSIIFSAILAKLKSFNTLDFHLPLEGACFLWSGTSAKPITLVDIGARFNRLWHAVQGSRCEMSRLVLSGMLYDDEDKELIEDKETFYQLLADNKQPIYDLDPSNGRVKLDEGAAVAWYHESWARQHLPPEAFGVGKRFPFMALALALRQKNIKMPSLDETTTKKKILRAEKTVERYVYAPFNPLVNMVTPFDTQLFGFYSSVDGVNLDELIEPGDGKVPLPFYIDLRPPRPLEVKCSQALGPALPAVAKEQL